MELWLREISATLPGTRLHINCYSVVPLIRRLFSKKIYKCYRYYINIKCVRNLLFQLNVNLVSFFFENG